MRLSFHFCRIVLLLLSTCFGECGSQSSGTSPRIIPPIEIAPIIHKIPEHIGFSISGLCFFNDNLYVSSNIGLFEFHGDSLIHLLKWYDRDDVISGPWLDSLYNRLWILHDGLNSFFVFDGTSWEKFNIPVPKRGYTRGNILAGIRTYSNSRDLYVEGGGTYWKWNDKSSIWEEQNVPTSGTLVRIALLDSVVFCIMRNELFPFLIKGDDFQSDSIYFFSERWNVVPNKSGTNFFVEQALTSSDNNVYLLTQNGRVLSMTNDGVKEIHTPGPSDVISLGSSGQLISSFHHMGVYSYRQYWQKLFSSPYPPTMHEFWAHLAQSSTTCALAVTPKPILSGNDFIYKGKTSLWISEQDSLKEIMFSY